MEYVLFSAVLFAISYIFPQISILSTFIFLVPLIMALNRQNLTFWHGVVWGCVVFTVQLWWLLVLIWLKACGPQGVILWLMTVGWFSLLSGLWIYFFHYSQVWTTLLFFYVILNYSLSFWGVVEGYPFFNPLIPLSYYPKLLWGMRYFGTYSYLLCLIVFQIYFSWLLTRPSSFKACKAAIWLTPFILGVFLYQKNEMSMPSIGYIRPWWYGDKNPMFVGYRIAHEISEHLNKYPQTQIIMLPESAFSWNIYEFHNFFAIWCQDIPTIPILLGCHRVHEKNTMNSCVIIRNNRIEFCYDKQHLMPLVERIPKIFDFIGCGEIFTKKNNVFSYANSSKDCCVLQGVKYQIFICSELFFEIKKIQGCPIIFIWNEAWLCCDYMKNLAELYIRYFELKYGVCVLHCSTLGKQNLMKSSIAI